jgi:CDP-6-deoxy-D-xylo-4-hexulose-3-dehydrase
VDHKIDELSTEELRAEILRLSREYSIRTHRQNRPAADALAPQFVAGKTPVPYAGRVFTEDEVEAAVAATLDFWLTLGPEGEQFERGLAAFLGTRTSVSVNSGSSANLLAMASLTSHKVPEQRRVGSGDEVITVAAGFPTTVAPIIQCGAVPVFIDADPVTGNPCCGALQEAYVPGKTKAVFMAHALGNPFDLASALRFCREHDLWLIEDNCDALGSSYTLAADSPLLADFPNDMRNKDGSLTKLTGSWGDLSTQSFYPPHHLTMGEGGAVNIVRLAALKPIVESFRDWGRDCWCAPGKANTCNKRFQWQLGELPEGYDHKYVYSHLGFNLKPLDIQAAIGREQLKKLPSFIDERKANWQYLRKGLGELEEFIEFALPTHATAWHTDGSFCWDKTGCQTDCAWFGFKMSIRENAPFSHIDLARYLDEKKIGNRMLFGGNLLRQPALVQLRRDNPNAIRVVGDLSGADDIMNRTIFIGTYPGLTAAMLDYVIDTIVTYCHN